VNLDGGSRPLLLAHRGDQTVAVENTLAAIVAALRRPGIDGVEFDVRAANDGTPVVVHDPTLWRVQKVDRPVADLSPAELEALGVPTLAAVLAALPGAAFLDVELKEAVGTSVVPVLEAARGSQLYRAVVSSFDPAILDQVARLRPGWPRWLNAEDLAPSTLHLARRLGCTGVSVEWHAVDPPGLRRARELGLQVAVWTVRQRRTLARLLRLDLAALCVEGPALAAAADR
jgi:glycerophosphoryl diester phosphodiesterase